MTIRLRIDGDESFRRRFRSNKDHLWMVGPKSAPNSDFLDVNLRILRTPNTTILFINMLTECETCFITEENSVRKITIHRLLFKHPFHVHIYDVVNDKLASVVAWAELYMDVGVDLNAKYAIKCRKTVLISENDEESTHSGLRQYFHLQYGPNVSRYWKSCSHPCIVFMRNLIIKLYLVLKLSLKNISILPLKYDIFSGMKFLEDDAQAFQIL